MNEGIEPLETSAALNRLLRAELTAVNQQSVHLLALRRWGGGELEARIREVDRADFPATLEIIEYLVAAGLPLTIVSEGFVPGADERAILLAEQRAEADLMAAVAPLAGCAGPAGRLAAAVAAPRPDYAAWIAARLPLAPERVPSPEPLVAEFADLFAGLTVLGEQALIHAFVHWHRGDRIDADAAWGVSGAAMLRAGDIISLLADRHAVPVPGALPTLVVRAAPAEALAADRHLAGICRSTAMALAERCSTEPVRSLANRAADAAAVWMDRVAGTILPPAAGVTRTFASFERTRQKYLRAAPANEQK
jgi:hypothetical protein